MKPTADTDPVPSSFPSPAAAARGANGNGVHALTNGTSSNGVNGGASRRQAAVAPKSNGDWIPLVAAIGRHWVWVVATAAVFTVVGALVANKIWSTAYSAGSQLVRYDTPDKELFKPREIAAATLASMVNSTEVRSRVGERANPQLTPSEVGSRVYLMPERQSDIINISFAGRSAEEAIALANIYAEEAVKFTQEMQTRDAAEAASYLRHQLRETEAQIADLNRKFEALGPAAIAAASGAPSALQMRLEEARLELADLLGRYRENHPRVQEQQARVAALEKQAGPAVQAEPVPAGAAGQYDMLREAHRALDAQRIELSTRLQLTEMLGQNPPGYYRLFSRASDASVAAESPIIKIGAFALFLGLCGLMLGAAGAITDELMDRRLKSPSDVRRVTKLPLLATLGSIEKMSSAARQRWAFRTWTALQGRLAYSPNQGLVCGITSSTAGEGRSLWIKLLSEAASQCGFRVITITTKPDAESDTSRRTEARPARASNVRFNTGHGEVKSAEPVLVHETTLSDTMLEDPQESVEQMLAPEGTSIVHLPLPGWVGNLERRKQWLASLDAWRTHENVVIFVELPPASNAEAVLLAQNLPNVVWLTDGTRAEALETSRQIETLRHARCNLVGAFMNRNTVSQLQERFARWIPATASAIALLAFAAPSDASAQTMADQPQPSSFSIVSPQQRAAWQQELTLGPGDVLRIALFGEPQLTRTEVAVQPDGRISFLEARDIVAAGLTIDELRVKIDQALGEFRRAPRTMISPVEFRSKRYYMLGQIAEKGAFTLDRPMTVLEAVARARGFETGMSGNDVVDMADLSHAFLVRNGERRAVNFEKLFNEGDLSQNIAVEPGDYFFFPPAGVREVYVLGEVALPGPATFTGESTTLRAVAARGGFTSRAWKNRVLVVRGSLNNPQPVVVNLGDVLTGRANDVQLQPRDIVYVSAKPWWKAEELLDEAASAFAQSLVVYWTSDKVVPVVPLR